MNADRLSESKETAEILYLVVPPARTPGLRRDEAGSLRSPAVPGGTPGSVAKPRTHRRGRRGYEEAKPADQVVPPSSAVFRSRWQAQDSPAVRAVTRPPIVDRAYFVLWIFVRSAPYRSLKNGLLAILGSIGFAGLCLIGLYTIYYVKSIAGIDLFPTKHLEDFVPVPGYHRW